MHGQHFLIAAEVGRGQVGNQMQQAQPVLRGRALLAAEILLYVRAGRFAPPVLDAWAGHQQTAAHVLHHLDRLVVVRGELVLRHVGHQRVRHRDPRRYDRMLLGRGHDQPLHRGVITGELGQFLADVAGLLDPVVLGDRLRRAGQQFEQWQLVRHRGEAVELDERQRHETRGRGLAGQEHALPRHEHVLEDGQRLHHLVIGADRVLERVLLKAAVRTRQQLDALGIRGHRERHGVVFVALAHGARRQHDDLVGIGRNRGMHLGPAHDDAVVAPVHDPHVIVGMFLPARPQAAVAFHVALRHGDRVVVVAAQCVVSADALAVLLRAVFGHFFGHDVQRQQRVGSDLLDEHDQRGPLARAGGDEPTALQEILGVARDLIEARVFLTGLRVGDHGQIAVARVFGHLEVDAGVCNRLSDDRMGGDVVHSFTPIIHLAAVFQTFFVLLRRTQTHVALLAVKSRASIAATARACPRSPRALLLDNRYEPVAAGKGSIIRAEGGEEAEQVDAGDG